MGPVEADFEIDVAVFGEVLYGFRDDARLSDWVRWKSGGEERPPGHRNGAAVTVVGDNHEKWFGVFLPRDAEPDVVAHEACHAAWDILDSRGVIVTHDNHEVLTYLIAYLVREIGKAKGVRRGKRRGFKNRRKDHDHDRTRPGVPACKDTGWLRYSV